MFYVTQLISEVDNLLKVINRGNILPISYPYCLKKSKSGYSFHLTPIYQRFHWKLHFFFFILTSIFCLIRLNQESKSVYAFSITGFCFIGNILVACTVLFHFFYGAQFVNFFNQLIYFERRYCNILELK